ncbi:MAG: 50S ribosomal protein L28 [Chloroflexi bacterium]|nr:50S ribosomal protein L28 [Chloroflexota bacterium]MQG03267.1 50S ribosomal protein L28 [SAR202 cluster bacterium]HAE32489.1 50S ribosomal protein L28 [Dehalococcoidia bacterium]
MAICAICNKSGQSGNNVSHSKRRTRTRWSVNIQKATVEINGVTQKANVCTRCLRTQYKSAMKD